MNKFLKSKPILTICAGLFILAACNMATVDFGNDSSAYAKDGECDDPRFIGTGMATSLDRDNTAADATDCRKLYTLGQVQAVSATIGQARTQCDAINFGNNQSTWANDNECDDPRFEGPGASSIMLPDDLGGDANDCRATCNAGTVWLRTAG